MFTIRMLLCKQYVNECKLMVKIAELVFSFVSVYVVQSMFEFFFKSSFILKYFNITVVGVRINNNHLLQERASFS